MMRDAFLLDPDVVYLNHGSFGACPRAVFEVYQAWQRELENQPVEFLGRRAEPLLANARTALSDYLGCAPDEIVYFPNPTTALNVVARSLDLNPGDEVLGTDHEYGALDRTWRYICKRRGATYIQTTITLPLRDPEEVLERIWSRVTANTRVIFISHITSPTAIRFPVEAICKRARQEGLLTIIDGAHAPGQLALNLTSLGADFYAGACHKWLCAPKGSSFLYARREVQGLLEPLVISWGWEAEHPGESQFIDYHEWQGTRDLAAFLSVPAAIAFQKEHNWPRVRQRCHALALELQEALIADCKSTPLTPPRSDGFMQMFAVQVDVRDATVLQQRLFEEHKIEILAQTWKSLPLLRPSLQAYNTRKDCDALIQALKHILA